MVRNFYDHEHITKKLEHLYQTELQSSAGLKI